MFKSIRFQLLLIAAVPLLFGIVLSAISVYTAYDKFTEMTKVHSFVQLANRVSAHVHETQKERGLTAGFMGSGGKTFATELAEQRAITDTRRKALNEYLATFDAGACAAEPWQAVSETEVKRAEKRLSLF